MPPSRSKLLWKLCITNMPTQDECVCAVGSSSEWMNSVISMYTTVYHPGFSYVCLDPWDLQAAY